jgi:predicted RNase H-like nuclease
MYTGVDACGSGWVSVSFGDGVRVVCRDRFVGVYEEVSEDAMVLVDIPIGLPEEGRRVCDEEAKDVLGCRGSSVFYAPPQEAVYSDSYSEANESADVGVQPPAWGIAEEMREVNDLVVDGGCQGADVHETHPEVCFYGLCGLPIPYSKKTERGREARNSVLCRYEERLGFSVDDVVSEAVERKGVAPDDALDALAAAVTARIGTEDGYERLGGGTGEILYVDDADQPF